MYQEKPSQVSNRPPKVMQEIEGAQKMFPKLKKVKGSNFQYS